MQKIKLLQLLSGLTKKEVSAFGRHINKMYGGYETALSLFQYLKSRHSNLDGIDFNSTSILTKILGIKHLEENVDYKKRILNEASRIYLWLEDYLLLQKLNEAENPERDLLLASIFREKKVSQLFKLRVQNALNIYDKKPAPDIWHIFNALKIQHLWYHYADPAEGLHTSDKASARGLMDKLDSFCLAARLMYGTELHNRNNILREGNEVPDWEQTLEAAQSDHCSKQRIHEGFRLAALLVGQPEDSHYQQLESFLAKHYVDFAPEVLQILHGYLINFAALRIKQSQAGWMDKLLKLYEFAGVMPKLFEHGLISSIRFLNIVNLACTQQKVDWAASFVKEWYIHLRPHLQTETKAIAEALIAFERKQFDETLKILRTQKSTDPFLEARIRSLQLMAMVETDAGLTTTLDDCRNFKAFLRRNKILGKTTVSGFTNFTKSLEVYLQRSVPSDKQKEIVENYELIFNKKWLLSII